MRAARVDANQQQIIRGFMLHGAAVQSLAKVTDGCPDLLIAYRGRWILVEVKARDAADVPRILGCRGPGAPTPHHRNESEAKRG